MNEERGESQMMQDGERKRNISHLICYSAHIIYIENNSL